MSEQDFTITRESTAPRELVFKAWTDCGRLSRWWGPRDFTTSHCAIDAPVRFVIDEGFSDEQGNRLTAQDYGMTDDMPSEDRVTVTLEERDGRTRMTMQQGIPRDVAERNGAPRGWRETFDKLDSYLSELRRGTGFAH